MANAIVLLTVVLLAIAALSDGRLQIAHLFLPVGVRRLTVIVLAPGALADAWDALDAPLQAHAVELLTPATIAVATLKGSS